ncbi:hypothetical protein FM120_29445 [Sphingobacterium faecium PCAi_F2.5]|nr:hypothetical protein FM120_29445 [Sphingobacterium faecium PCAi_F2.5]
MIFSFYVQFVRISAFCFLNFCSIQSIVLQRDDLALCFKVYY